MVFRRPIHPHLSGYARCNSSGAFIATQPDLAGQEQPHMKVAAPHQEELDTMKEEIAQLKAQIALLLGQATEKKKHK